MFYSKELIKTITYLLELPDKNYEECRAEVEKLSPYIRNLYRKVFAEVDKKREKYKGAE